MRLYAPGGLSVGEPFNIPNLQQKNWSFEGKIMKKEKVDCI